MKVLVTGAAGFIGMHVCEGLLARGDEVTGLDNLNDYYDPALKRARLAQLARFPGFRMEVADIADPSRIDTVMREGAFGRVVHLAAQAGVRYSLKNPDAYVRSNLVGFNNVIEACRQAGTAHLVYASSSSVYGGNTKIPFSETDRVDHPVSLYAATKKANELVAHSYSHLFRLPTTGLRFFTVYGPWGRPDMAATLFAHAIQAGTPIDVFNSGRMSRDFTYVGDAVEAVLRAVDKIPESIGNDSAGTDAPARIFNVGNHTAVPLLEFIGTLERLFGRSAPRRMLPLQPGDLESTVADTAALEAWTGFSPHTTLAEGLARFADWYRGYYVTGELSPTQS